MGKKMIDNKLLYANIKALSAYKNVKIGNIERSCGLNAGYLSRLARDNIRYVRLDVILAFSDALGVTVESLVRGNMLEYVERKKRREEIERLTAELEKLQNEQAFPDGTDYREIIKSMRSRKGDDEE